MKLKIVLSLLFVVIVSSLVLFFTLTRQSIWKYNILYPEINGYTSSPVATSVNDFIEIDFTDFVYRGGENFNINFNSPFISINGEKKGIILEHKSDIKKISKNFIHIACIIDIDDELIKALQKIEVPFFLDLFASTAVKNVEALNSIKNLTHIKVNIYRFEGYDTQYLKEKKQIDKIDLTPLNNLKCPFLFVKSERPEIDIELPVLKCTDLSIATSKPDIFDKISKMKNLRSLDLKYSNFLRHDSLKEIGNLQKLRYLTIKPESRDWESYSHLYNFKNLTHLSINDNLFNDLDEGLTENVIIPNLVYLKVTKSYRSEKFTEIKLPANREIRFKNLLVLEDHTISMLREFTEKDIKFDKLRALTVKDEGAFEISGILKGKDQLEYIKTDKIFKEDDFKRISKMKSLIYAALNSSKIDDSHIDYIKNLPLLEVLDLSSSSVTNAGVRKLVHIPNLRKLNLKYSKITNGALKSIADIGRLEFLNLEHTSILNAYEYKSWEEIYNLIEERLVDQNLKETVFKYFLTATVGIAKVPGENDSFHEETFDCGYRYSPVKDHIIYLLDGFSQSFDKSFNFHNTREKKDDENLSAFIMKKTGVPLILSTQEFKAGPLNFYNKEALKRLYLMTKLSSTQMIGRDSAKSIYKALIRKAVRKRVQDVIKLLKNRENTDSMISFFKEMLSSEANGTVAQYKTWKQFCHENKKECLNVEEAEILGFLLRRKMDGTLSTILEITLDFLMDYDYDFYKEINQRLSEFIQQQE